MSKYNDLIAETEKVLAALRAAEEPHYIRHLDDCLGVLRVSGDSAEESRAIKSIREHVGIRVLGDSVPKGIAAEKWNEMLQAVINAVREHQPEKLERRKKSKTLYRGGL